MGILKRIFGWLLLSMCALFLVHTVVNFPINKMDCFGCIVGWLATGLISAAVCYHFGAKWVRSG